MLTETIGVEASLVALDDRVIDALRCRPWVVLGMSQEDSSEASQGLLCGRPAAEASQHLPLSAEDEAIRWRRIGTTCLTGGLD